MIANRKFAAVENGLPKRWTTTAGGGRVATDDTVTYEANGLKSAELVIKGKQDI